MRLRYLHRTGNLNEMAMTNIYRATLQELPADAYKYKRQNDTTLPANK